MAKKLKFNIPTVFVIFGATGDLSQKKLLPALFGLHQKKLLPSKFKIIGFSRREYHDQEYRRFAQKAVLADRRRHTAKTTRSFLKNIDYASGLFENKKAYQKLSATLKEFDQKIRQCSNKLFYLAVPPFLYQTILKNLAQSGLTESCNDQNGWTRVLIEKPFGKDTSGAKKLDQKLGSLFKEKQIFRIDHYLAKQTVQNILAFRFSNSIFEPIWNHQFIEKIEIKLLEKSGVGARGSFYDGIGALRDVGQNHILQMLTLVTMENPQILKTDAIRKKRAEAVKNLKKISLKEIKKHVIRGQYRGYLKEKGVRPNSQTETYFKIKAFLNSPRWKNVPFYLESGKALNTNATEISVHFRPVTPCFCPKPHRQHRHQNLISFKIQPEEKILIRFWAKQYGFSQNLVPKDLSFSYQNSTNANANAYEKVLYYTISGDQTIFTATNEVIKAWHFIESIIKGWNNLKLYPYQKGSAGPNINLN